MHVVSVVNVVKHDHGHLPLWLLYELLKPLCRHMSLHRSCRVFAPKPLASFFSWQALLQLRADPSLANYEGPHWLGPTFRGRIDFDLLVLRREWGNGMINGGGRTIINGMIINGILLMG